MLWFHSARVLGAASLLHLLLHVSAVHATTLHHWRFETVPGYLSDSAGSAPLLNVGSAQWALTGAGAGASFRGYDGSRFAADVSAGGLSTTLADAPPGNFTIELFVHPNGPPAGGFGAVLAGALSSRANANVGWILQDRGGGLTLLFCSGSSCQFVPSGIALTQGTDYYVAASFDLAGGEAVFYVRDLESAAPMQVVTVAHDVTAFNPIATFVIARVFAFDGLIDEVRLSDTVLTPEDLLIAAWSSSPPPEFEQVPLPPGMLVPLAAIVALAGWRWHTSAHGRALSK